VVLTPFPADIAASPLNVIYDKGMTFDPENIPLVLNDWFSTRITYQGPGRAEFLDPPGAIEGTTLIEIDENGTSNIAMDVERIVSEHPLELGLMQLFSAQKPIEGSGGIMISGGGEQFNPCIKLSVTTSEGEFTATEGIHYGHHVDFPDCITGKVTFTALRSQFDAAGRDHPMYWVIPLSNFLSRFVSRHSTLNRHPLRIYPTPLVPDGLAEEDAFIATHNANRRNHLITFEFMGTAGFIEALPDYSVREKNLTEGCERCSITAVMVGEVGSNSIEQAI
jgi:hypothetical protein